MMAGTLPVTDMAKYRNILDIAWNEPCRSKPMCLAVPGEIISIDRSDPEHKMARVKFGEITKDISIQWIEDVSEGDYIIAHIGTALHKIDEKDAKATLDLLNEMGEL
jgi:hydrogenase expression/formation protein HypC